jgi:putative flippase GtrA
MSDVGSVATVRGLQDSGLRRLVTFGFVGVAATATHFCVALFCNAELHVAPLVANVFGYVFAVAVSYCGNAVFTFRRTIADAAQFFRFAVISLAGLALSQTITYLATKVLNLPFAIALAPVVTLVPAFTYAASSLWGFADRSSGRDGAGPSADRDLDRP